MDRPHFKVANWAEYQHYKDRNPPWIKLHRHIVTSEMWVSCDDASRVLAIACMVIAAEFDGCVPANPAFIMRRCYLSAEPDFKPLVDSGFLIDASGVLATCEQDASRMLDQRQRREEKRREEKDSLVLSQAKSTTDHRFETFWNAWPAGHKKSKRAAEKAFKTAIKRAGDVQVMVDALEAQKGGSKWREDNGRYIPLPSRWLNEDRWEDDTVIPEREYVPGDLPF
jgi:hypothetical protein